MCSPCSHQAVVDHTLRLQRHNLGRGLAEVRNRRRHTHKNFVLFDLIFTNKNNRSAIVFNGK